jgi:hypothetical protein
VRGLHAFVRFRDRSLRIRETDDDLSLASRALTDGNMGTFRKIYFFLAIISLLFLLASLLPAL